MVQVLQDLERVLDDLVRLGAFDMRHKADTASVMLLCRRIQTFFLEMRDLGSRRHGALLNIQNREDYRNATKVPRKLIGVRFQLFLE